MQSPLLPKIPLFFKFLDCHGSKDETVHRLTHAVIAAICNKVALRADAFSVARFEASREIWFKGSHKKAQIIIWVFSAALCVSLRPLR